MNQQQWPSQTLRSYNEGVLRISKYGHAISHTWSEGSTKKPKPVAPVHLPIRGGREERVQLAKTAQCHYAERYLEVAQNAGVRASLLVESIAEENKYRRMFAQDRTNAALDDPYATLIPVARYENIFHCVTPSTTPVVFPLGDKAKKVGESSIVDAETFRQRFDVFSEGLLSHLNWDNVFIAGGAVLACLQPVPAEYAESNHRLREYYHDVAYKNSDIDLFIYGLDEEEAKQKLLEIYFAVCERTLPLVHTIAFRSTNAITIVSQYPYRHVQIVLRLYKSPAEVLMGFDVDSCSIGYDGTSVWMTPRCHSALVAQANTIDLSRRSPTYETRLAKYATRGFAVELPTLQRDLVDPQIFERRFDTVKGLAKLLLFERLSTPEARAKFKEEQRRKQLRPIYEKTGKYTNVIMHEFAHDTYLVERLEEQQASPSDYSTVFLPWGPKWDARKIRKLMYTKDVLLNLDLSQPSGIQRHRHPCFFGTMEEVIHDCCGQCPDLGDVQPDDAADFVSGELKLMTVNPGQQAIGSFHPITEGDWTEGAYVNAGTESLIMAVASLDPLRFQTALEEPTVSINAKDVTGRTPLIIAAFTGNVDAARELIKRGARLCEKTTDGRTALHIAAAYGHAAIIDLIVERGRILNVELEQELRRERQAELARREADAAAEGTGPRDRDYWRRRYLRKMAREAEEAKRKAELEERKALDRLDIDQKDTDWLMTPLMYAVFFGKEECVQTLIKNGANVDQQLVYETNGVPTVSYSLLQLALFGNHVKIVHLLLTEGIDLSMVDVKGQTILHSAAKYLRTEILKEVVTWKGTDKAKQLPTPFPGQSEDWQLSMSNPAFYSSNASPEEFASALRLKMQSQRPKGPNVASANTPDSDHKSPLALVVEGWPQFREQGRLEEARTAVQVLLENTPAPQQPPQPMHAYSDPQPLHIAAQSGEPSILQLLLEHGTDPNTLQSLPASGWRQRNRPPETPLDLVLSSLEQCRQMAEVPYTVCATNQEYLEFLLSKAEQGSYESYLLNKMKEREYTGQAGSMPCETTDEQDEAKAKQLQAQEQRRARLTECRELLMAAKAKRFVQLAIPENDPKGYRALQTQAKQQSASFAQSIAFKIGITSAMYNISTCFDEMFEPLDRKKCAANFGPHMQPRYRDLFNAIVQGNVAAIQQLVQPTADPQEQVIVCVRSKLLCITTLQLAMDRDLPAVVRLLVQVAAQQYSAPKPPESLAKLSSGVRRVDNMQIVAAVESSQSTVNVLQQLQQSMAWPGSLQAKTEEDALLDDVPCSMPPSDYVKYTGAYPDCNAVGIAIQKGSISALRALFDTCDELHLMTGPHEDINLVGYLLRSQCICISGRNVKGTPFAAAMHFNQVEVAKLLLQRGAMDCFEIDVDSLIKSGEGSYYEGLPIDGRKAEHHMPKQVRISRAFRRRHHMTGLHVAALAGSKDCIEFLLGTDSSGYIVLDPSTADDEDSAVGDPLFSLWQQNAIGWTALHEAVDHCNVDTLRCLIAAGTKAMGTAAVKDVIDICQSLPRNDGHRDPIMPVLILATDTLQLEAMQVLLEAKADTQVLCPAGETALHKAAARCFWEGLQLLLQHNANINASNRRGWTAMHVVVTSDKQPQQPRKPRPHPPEECLQLLLTSGPSIINQPSKAGETPLMLAAQYGRPTLLQNLLDAKADPSVLDLSGKSALHHAARGPSEACISLLLGHPIPTNAEDYEARTATDWCMTATERSLQSLKNCEYGAYSALQSATDGVVRDIVLASDFRAHTLRVAENVDTFLGDGGSGIADDRNGAGGRSQELHHDDDAGNEDDDEEDEEEEDQEEGDDDDDDDDEEGSD